MDIRQYRVIYNLTEDIRKALEEGLAPEIREEILGRDTVGSPGNQSCYGY